MKPAILAVTLTIASAPLAVCAVSEQAGRPGKTPPPAATPVPEFKPAAPLAPVTNRLLDSAALPDVPGGMDGARRPEPRFENLPLYDAPSLPYRPRQPQTPQEAEEFMERYRRRTYRSMPVYVIPLTGEIR